ncbi:NADP-dependent oxidoreductase [Billgrantia tianxiuensis]|jgi:NADPH-dependent curcumin reductase CurA|uniref:NADP-dependent oxidoreductase n=1 Tax=Billgrantia tianxiuensis TaxID=2497861 RepID=A0A6I6SVR3_9GAMM|nr:MULTISPECIES: NADP-dependent oxidoreductase [Halomonas]MCE8033849.1 NADP-dependent oxidoreductase [Halomonas sp. MCCC 1A11057]QHC51403.1 NADP-dependent oxidoreductase [Halomonas tianxiuensis]
MPVSTLCWHLARRPEGIPETSDFVLREMPLPPLPWGQVELEVHGLSVDPYMRTRMQPEGYGYLAKWGPGTPLSAWGLARIRRSRGRWREGDWVVGHLPVADRVHLRVPEPDALLPLCLPATTPFPERWLHEHGMTGFTAWLGMRHYGRPQPGETVLVSAAAGAVGSLAVQLAHRAGARVIASAGNAAKRAWLRERLGVAATLDDRNPDGFADALAEAAPEGIDLDFESLGGAVFEAAVERLRPCGRVVLCGLISQYHDPEPRRAPPNLARLQVVGARLIPFVAPGHETEHWARFQTEMAGLEPVAPLDVLHGLEAWPRAFCGLFTGKGIGKRVVWLREDSSLLA